MPEVTHLIQTDALPAGVDAMAFPSRGEIMVRASLPAAGRRKPCEGRPPEPLS